jgi:GTP-binding protein LepA
MVFLGLFPIQTDEINQVRDALGKLRLSDSAFSYKPISSLALGNGFHCGFLGLLHAEVVQERLAREFNLALLATAPTVEYRIKLKSHQSSTYAKATADKSAISYQTSESSKLKAESFLTIQSASEFPDPSTIAQTYEPVMNVSIFAPKLYVGAIMQLCQDKRGEYIDLTYVSEQAKFTYLMPLSEMIVDFFDRLKSITEGYASLDYEFFDFQLVEVVKMDILLNHEKVDAFSQLIVSERAVIMGRMMVEKLAEVIPRHQFSVPIQAAIGGQIIARADVKAFRKDVTQKLYGGDRTRKDKLLEAQKKGKKRMKMVGKVEIPQEAFLKVFKQG